MRLRGRAIKVQKKRTNIAGMSKSGLGDRKYLIMAEMVKQFAPMQRGRCRRRGADGDV